MTTGDNERILICDFYHLGPTLWALSLPVMPKERREFHRMLKAWSKIVILHYNKLVILWGSGFCQCSFIAKQVSLLLACFLPIFSQFDKTRMWYTLFHIQRPTIDGTSSMGSWPVPVHCKMVNSFVKSHQVSLIPLVESSKDVSIYWREFFFDPLDCCGLCLCLRFSFLYTPW